MSTLKGSWVGAQDLPAMCGRPYHLDLVLLYLSEELGSVQDGSRTWKGNSGVAKLVPTNR